MKKIMFNDKYDLTGVVLSGRKTQTRRIIPKDFFSWTWDFDGENLWWEDCNGDWHDVRKSKFAFRKGEIIAIAQSYKEAGIQFIPEEDDEFGCHNFPAEQTHGWTNKMFVRADLMPHQIRITNIRVERLQDISDEDCLKEGIGVSPTENIVGYPFGVSFRYFIGEDKPECRYSTPRGAYAALIDKVSGKSTWETNPFVFVYDFELVR